jgi:hypothetical protein
MTNLVATPREPRVAVDADVEIVLVPCMLLQETEPHSESK